MKKFLQKYQEYIYAAVIISIFIILTILLLNLPINKTPNLLERVSGRILIQVYDQGQFWYVYPQDKKRYLLDDQGFEVLKKLAVKLEDPQQEKDYLGYVVTYDEQHYWFLNPADSEKYKFGNQNELVELIKQVGLGAYNRDLKRIETGNILDF